MRSISARCVGSYLLDTVTYSRWWLAQSARAAASGGIPTGLHGIARREYISMPAAIATGMNRRDADPASSTLLLLRQNAIT